GLVEITLSRGENPGPVDCNDVELSGKFSANSLGHRYGSARSGQYKSSCTSAKLPSRAKRAAGQRRLCPVFAKLFSEPAIHRETTLLGRAHYIEWSIPVKLRLPALSKLVRNVPFLTSLEMSPFLCLRLLSPCFSASADFFLEISRPVALG